MDGLIVYVLKAIMFTRRRILLLILWSLSLAGAAQWGAHAAADLPGTETRFVVTGSRDGIHTGHFMARVGSRWVVVQVDPPRAILEPLIERGPE